MKMIKQKTKEYAHKYTTKHKQRERAIVGIDRAYRGEVRG